MVRTRHEQRKAATHQDLIDAARDAIAEQGYNHVDILDITERADVSKATFYKHFANKEACVRELMQQGFDALVEEVFSADRPQTISPEWIRNSFEKLFTWAEENRDFLLIMVGGAASTQLNAFGRNYMAEVVERTITSEFIPENPNARFSPTIQSQVITGIVIQLLGWWLENETGYSPSDMAQIVQDALLCGIGDLDFLTQSL